MPRIKAGKININYETTGQGEPLLLIMGFGMPGAAWVPMLPLLGGFKCIYFDNRGTGNKLRRWCWAAPCLADRERSWRYPSSEKS